MGLHVVKLLVFIAMLLGPCGLALLSLRLPTLLEPEDGEELIPHGITLHVVQFGQQWQLNAYSTDCDDESWIYNTEAEAREAQARMLLKLRALQRRGGLRQIHLVDEPDQEGQPKNGTMPLR